MATYEAVKLRDGALVAGLTNVPDFDAALAARVDVLGRVGNGDGAHHLAMAQCVDLTCVARDPRPQKGVRWERHRLQLPVVALDASGGKMIVRLDHPDTEQVYVVEVDGSA